MNERAQIEFLNTIADDAMGMEPGDRKQAKEAADTIERLLAENEQLLRRRKSLDAYLHLKNQRIEKLEAENQRLKGIMQECGKDDALAHLHLHEIGELKVRIEKLEAVLSAATEMTLASWNDMPAVDDALEKLIEAIAEAEK
jgi:predicted nuclease with TOPRIM domain